MGFWGKLGKGLLKVAPYAAMAIPGIGPAASIAIQAGLGAANAKASGGGWKDALIGAGTGALTSKMGGFGKGLSPSSGNFVKNAVSDVAKKATGGGFKSALGNFAKQAGSNILSSSLGGGEDPVSKLKKMGAWNEGYFGKGGAGGGWQGALGGILDTFGRRDEEPNLGSRRGMPDLAMNIDNTAVPRAGQGLSRFHQQMRRQLGPVMGQSDQNFPNLADSIGAGRMDAIRNQPWRGGYDVTTRGEDDVDTVTRMPPIFPTGGRGRRGARNY